MRARLIQRLELPLTDENRLTAACRLDGLGVAVLRDLAAAGAERRRITVRRTIWARVAPDGAERIVAYGTVREMRLALDAEGADVVLSAIEAEALLDTGDER